MRVTSVVSIPLHELVITAIRSSGAGGQHVNKTNSRVTVRWNVRTTQALSDEQKMRVLEKLSPKLTSEGALIIHNSESRSQHHNRASALDNLADTVRKSLYIPKKRMKRRISQTAIEKRLREKSLRSNVKKLRSSKNINE